MIKSFKSRALKKFWTRRDASGLRPDWVDRVRIVLSALDSAHQPSDLDLPGLRFHVLTGNRKGTFSLLVSRNWRITFVWSGKDAFDIDLEDYHG